jgi:hypothetical protein
MVILLGLALPVALFAQVPQDAEKGMLQKLGLNDGQVAQVLDIQSKTETTVRQDAAQIRVLRAQMDKALLAPAATVDVKTVNGFVDQIAQSRADIQKTLVGAQLQLRQIMGDTNFRVYERYIRHQIRRVMVAHRPMGRMGPRQDPDGRAWGGMSGMMFESF